MRYDIPGVNFDSSDCSILLCSGEDSIWMGAEDIQALITKLLAAHAEYVDEQNRRAANGG